MIFHYFSYNAMYFEITMVSLIYLPTAVWLRSFTYLYNYVALQTHNGMGLIWNIRYIAGLLPYCYIVPCIVMTFMQHTGYIRIHLELEYNTHTASQFTLLRLTPKKVVHWLAILPLITSQYNCLHYFLQCSCQSAISSID